MTRKTTIIIISTVALIFIILLLTKILLDSDGEDNPEITVGEISTEIDEEGNSLIFNKLENYRLIATKDWRVPKDAIESSNLWLVYVPNENLSLNVLVFDNIEALSLSNWLDNAKEANSFYSKYTYMPINNELYKFRGELYRDDFDKTGDPVEVPVENSAIVGYIVSVGEKVYSIYCAADEKEAINLIHLCENTAFTFKPDGVSIDSFERLQVLVEESPIIYNLPYYSHGFEVDYRIDDVETGVSYKIFLIPITNPENKEAYTAEIGSLRSDALEWIRDNGVDPDTLSTEWTTR